MSYEEWIENIMLVDANNDFYLSTEDEQIVKRYLTKKGFDKMNNEVLYLYEQRKKENIKTKYEEIIKKEYEELEEVKLYNELTTTFDKNLKELVEKFNTESYKPFKTRCYTNNFQYEIDPSLLLKIRHKHQEAFDNEIKALLQLTEEVSAQLSLSDDKDYQIEVLKKYEILDKKGLLNA